MQYFTPTSSYLLGICIDMGEGRRCSVASFNDIVLNPPLPQGQPFTASILKELPELSKAAPRNWQLLISFFFAKISNTQGAHSGDSQLPLHRNENKVISFPFSFTFHSCLLATNATLTYRDYCIASPFAHISCHTHMIKIFSICCSSFSSHSLSLWMSKRTYWLILSVVSKKWEAKARQCSAGLLAGHRIMKQYLYLR